MSPLKIMLVDDEPIIRKALKLELNAQPHTVACGMNDDGVVEHREIRVLDTFATGAQLMAALDSPAEHEMPDYLLLDMELQGEPTGGIFIADRVHRKYPDIRIAILSGRFDNPPAGELHRDDERPAVGERGTWVTFKCPRVRVGDKVFYIEQRAGRLQK